MPYLNVMDLIRNGFTHHREITDWANAAGLCTPNTWPSKPWIDNLLPKVDRNTQLLADQDLPRCPNCGENVFQCSMRSLVCRGTLEERTTKLGALAGAKQNEQHRGH